MKLARPTEPVTTTIPGHIWPNSICIKDMAALLKPQAAYDLVKGIKDTCGSDVRVHVHVHATTGVTMVSLMKEQYVVAEETTKPCPF